jgi:type II secretory pathway component GspD/PulD (secretin)
LLGRRRPVKIYAHIIMLPDSTRAALLSSRVLASPTFLTPGGLQAWLIHDAEFKALQERFRQTPGVDFLSSPRIMTADGVQATLFSGESISLHGLKNDVGTRLDCFPRVRSQSTDLFVNVTFSEASTNPAGTAAALGTAGLISIQTNLDIAARLQIPKGSGVLFLNGIPGEANHKVFGLLIDPP